jgi:hypothetical protein
VITQKEIVATVDTKVKKVKKLKEVKGRNIMDVPDGSYCNIPFTGVELVNLVELLAFSKGAFKFLADEAMVKNDFSGMELYLRSQKRSEELYAKLVAFAKIGEPTAPLQ